MSSVFSIGDSVTFINEKQNGIVLGFKSNNIVIVEIEDGFTLDVLSREIVVVKSSQEKAMGVSTSESKPIDKKEAISPVPAFATHIDQSSVVLLTVPEQSAVLTGKIKFMLVNPLSGQLQGACFEKQKNKLKRVAVFALDSQQQTELFEYTREQLMSFDSIVISYVYSDATMFSSGSKEITIEYPGLVQHFPQLVSPYCFACSHDVYRSTNTNEDLELDLLKDKYNPAANQKTNPVSKPNEAKVKKQEGNLLRKYGLSGVNSIVDLHIESLIEYPEGYSNSELIRIQLNHFRSELDKAMVAKMHSIVFIHGVGNGKLKDAIISELKELNLKYRPGDFSKYGIGATEVLIV
jgi:hypothetical protein